MTFQTKQQELDAKARMAEIEREEQAEAEARERAKKNDNFYMIFREHADKIDELIKISPPAAQIFMFLAKTVDRTNALVASGKAIASECNLSEATVSRALKVLTAKDENGNGKYLEIIKTGQSNIFVLNPDIVWNAWATGKDSCLFGNAKVLVSVNEQDTIMRKRLTMLIQKKISETKMLEVDKKEEPPEAFQPFEKQ